MKYSRVCKQIYLMYIHIKIIASQMLIFVILFPLIAVKAPDFQSLLTYSQILSKTKIKLNYFCFDTTDSVTNFERELEKCINDLINAEDYENALELSKAANLSSSKVILAQVCKLNFTLN